MTMTKTLSQQITDNMYGALADTATTYIDELIKNKVKKTKIQITDLIAELSTRIVRKQNEIDFRNESCVKLNETFKKLVEYSDSFNRAQINKLTTIFHYLDTYYQYQHTPEPKYVAFDVKILINLALSKKVDRDVKGYLIERLASCSINRRHVNVLKIKPETFEHVAVADKNYLCSEFARNSTSWAFANIELVSECIIQDDNKDMALIIIMNSLGNEDTYGMHSNYVTKISTREIDHIRKIKEHLFGSLEHFKQLKDIADSLGCLRDESYWRAAVYKHDTCVVPTVQIEF